MELPKTLLALGITVRTEDTARSRQVAHLAGRIGYAYVWVVTGRPVALAEVRELAAAAAPARLGLVIADVALAAGWLAATRDDPVLGKLPLETPGGTGDREALTAALGDEGYGARAYPRVLDLLSGGHVVGGPDAAAVVQRLTAARSARNAAGRTPADFPINVDIGVAIGRTMGEAQARLLRDPALAGRVDLREAGLFGTFEDAQARVLAYARAGADGLRATLADGHDVADLLAHLRAVTVGPVGVLLNRPTAS